MLIDLKQLTPHLQRYTINFGITIDNLNNPNVDEHGANTPTQMTNNTIRKMGANEEIHKEDNLLSEEDNIPSKEVRLNEEARLNEETRLREQALKTKTDTIIAEKKAIEAKNKATTAKILAMKTKKEIYIPIYRQYTDLNTRLKNTKKLLNDPNSKDTELKKKIPI